MHLGVGVCGQNLTDAMLNRWTNFGTKVPAICAGYV